MKRIATILSTLTLVLGLSAGVASAATISCNINNTGPGSTNICKGTDESNIDCSSDNTIEITNSNNQSSNSGDVFTVDNTNSGVTSSGNSNNSNSSSYTIAVGTPCVPVQIASTTTTTTPTPTATTTTVTPAPAAKAATPAPKVVSLPETGSNSAVKTAEVAGGSIALALVVSQIGITLYRRFAIK